MMRWGWCEKGVALCCRESERLTGETGVSFAALVRSFFAWQKISTRLFFTPCECASKAPGAFSFHFTTNGVSRDCEAVHYAQGAGTFGGELGVISGGLIEFGLGLCYICR